jgi:hypothetical protein
MLASSLGAQDLAPERIANMIGTFTSPGFLGTLPIPFVFSENGSVYSIKNSGENIPLDGFRQFVWTKTGPNTGVLTQTFSTGQIVRSLDFSSFSPSLGWSGSYREGNVQGIFTIAPFGLTSVAPLRNASARVTLAANGSAMMGFVVTGGTPRRVLVRAVGPALAQFGVGNPATAPVLTVHRGGTVIGSNSGWGGASETATVFARVGAFSLPPASGDCALVLTLSAGNYTALVRADTGGDVLFEVYCVD